MKNVVLVIILVLCSSGCTTVSDISDRNSTEHLIGHGLLAVDTFLCAYEAIHESIPKKVVYENHGFERCPYGQHIAVLPAGTPVTIERVKVVKIRSVKSVDHWHLIGRLEHSNEDVRFHFHYGMGYLSEGQPWSPKEPPWSLESN